MRYLDAVLETQLSTLETLEFEFKESLDSQTGAYTMKTVEIKNRIDAIRISLIEDIKADYFKALQKQKAA